LLVSERQRAKQQERGSDSHKYDQRQRYIHTLHMYESDFAGSHASARCWYESDGGERRRACERERESGRERARERMTGEGIENERETMSYTHA